MGRAAVLIGVRKTGNLPELQAVKRSVREMAEWARSQGIDKELVQVVTDDRKPVNIQQIKDAIKRAVDRTTVEQLIVYFSGHGFNKESEFWLLSDSPGDPNAAVNVEGSIRLARYCGIKHVVLISDACRTAAEGLQALQVEGGLVFPTQPVSGTANPVDILFACARGKPSYEVSDPNKAAADAVNNFSAIYTEVLLEYLFGRHEEILKRVSEDGKEVGLVLLGELADCLKKEVPPRLTAKLGGDLKTNQYPDDIINRQTAEAWLARIRLPRRGEGGSRVDRPVTPVSRGTVYTPFTVSSALVSRALEGDLKQWNEILGSPGGGAEVESLKRAVITQAKPFGRTHFETMCGFKVRGARVARTVQRDIHAQILTSIPETIIRVVGLPPSGANILLVLENETGVVVPALPDFIAALTFDSAQLIDVSYEPSDNSPRWDEYSARADELRSLRASVAASASLGVFRLSGDGQLALARRMQIAKGVDPSLALYAGYAYDSLQRGDLIEEMRTYMIADLGLTFFDVALLSGGRKGQRIVPPFPMLSQGWPLLSAYQVELSAPLPGVERHRLPSLWTLLDKAGVATLEAAILSGEVR